MAEKAKSARICLRLLVRGMSAKEAREKASCSNEARDAVWPKEIKNNSSSQ